MTSLETIKKPIAEDLRQFEPYFRSLMKSSAPLLNIITSYIIKRKGKQMRPMLVFLAARLFGEINRSTFHAASMVELMHTATLIHDDVVDDSYQRRGIFSINALWKNKIAVLVGDYLLAKGMLLAVDNEEFALLKVVSGAVREMSEGELLQIEKARKLDISEDIYFDIIRKKTATLIATCAEAGARSVNADEESVARLKQFGECVGIAFQIRDDIFDYQTNGSIGKPVGNDLREKKMTLPLIHVLNHATLSDKRKIIGTIRRRNDNRTMMREIIRHVIDKGGLDYADLKMNEYRQKAIDLISGFPESEAKKALVDFVIYTTERKK
ncbi:MAG: polyprenyl synthetase family protein [Bacteroidetes bacterium]|nr:polyprenyl synthetase family protein [Bacteroidota bacterium]